MNNAPKIALSAKTCAMRLAALNVPFDAAALVNAAGCSHATAQVVLSKLVSDGSLARVSRGWFAAHGVIPVHKPKPGGPVAMARGEKEEAARQLMAAEAWLAECPKLPPARPPVFNERGQRRSA